MVIFPWKNGDFPNENGDFPIENGDFPIDSMVIFHSSVNVYQRVALVKDSILFLIILQMAPVLQWHEYFVAIFNRWHKYSIFVYAPCYSTRHERYIHML